MLPKTTTGGRSRTLYLMWAKSGLGVFQYAVDETDRRNQSYVSLEHLLNALAIQEPASFDTTLSSFGVNPQDFKKHIEQTMMSSSKHVGKGIRIAPEVIQIFRHSQDVARADRRKKIEAADLLKAFSQSFLWGKH